jgi:hypothetical protein
MAMKAIEKKFFVFEPEKNYFICCGKDKPKGTGFVYLETQKSDSGDGPYHATIRMKTDKRIIGLIPIKKTLQTREIMGFESPTDLNYEFSSEIKRLGEIAHRKSLEAKV